MLLSSTVESLSCTGRATICNMGAEIGATTSLFPFTDHRMVNHLNATKHSEIAQYVQCFSHNLQADEGAEYGQPIEIVLFFRCLKLILTILEQNSLSEIEPCINDPFTPDHATPLSEFAGEVKKTNWSQELEVALIGSCTNSSYGDMSRSASIAKEASVHGLQVKSKFAITPGSEQIRATIERDGQMAAFENVGGLVLANTCGPCIGQWINRMSSRERSARVSNPFDCLKCVHTPLSHQGLTMTMTIVVSSLVATCLCSRSTFVVVTTCNIYFSCFTLFDMVASTES